MNISEIILQQHPPPEIPVGVFWSIITLLIGIIVWVAIRYITRLDTLLERLDTAVEDIKSTLKLQGQRLDNHEAEIKSLKSTRHKRQ